MTAPIHSSLSSPLENGTALESQISASPDISIPDMSIPYTICEILVGVVAVIGNALTITVFAIDRKLRRLTNYYIVSLAIADLLVGVLGIPFAILTSIGLPKPLWGCLLMLSTLIVLCTISIFCLVALSVDRYWAILHPLRYSRVMTAKIARRIILVCWAAGIIVGFLPLMGWHEKYHGSCIFTLVMNYNYLVFLYFATIVGPGLLMAAFYSHIYTVVLKQTQLSVRSKHGTLRQIAAQEPQGDGGGAISEGSQKLQRPPFFSMRRYSRSHGNEGSTKYDPQQSTSSTSTNIVHQVTHASKREVKAAKSLSIIVLFFMVCWFPLYTINCVQAFCKSCHVPGGLMYFTITLSHLNSAINPFLYAYHMKDFRLALKVFILHRILRRPAQPEFGNRRSLVSPHHSTLYRVNMTGSSHFTNLHTPHAHNTPMTRSPSPLAGTPLGGLRSRSSTIGSLGSYHPPKRTSPSTSLPPTPEVTQIEPTHRPRAATITTHTSPTSAHVSSRIFEGHKKSSIDSDAGENVALLPQDEGIVKHMKEKFFDNNDDVCPVKGDFSGEKMISSSFASDVTELADAIILRSNNTKILSSAEQSVDSTLAVTSSDDTLTVTKPADDVTQNTDVIYTTTLSNASEDNLSFSSCSGKAHGNCNEIEDGHELAIDAHKRNTRRHLDAKSLEESESIPLMMDPDREMRSLEVINVGNGGRDSEYAQHITPPVSNGNIWNISKPLDVTELNPQNDEFNSELKTLDSQCADSLYQVKSRISDEEKCSESSPLSRELYKYLPKILRRRDESRQTKRKTSPSWWSDMVRHRSYHGMSLDIGSWRQLKRTRSDSGVMET